MLVFMVVAKAVEKNDHRCILIVRIGGGEMGAVPNKRAWSPILAAPLNDHRKLSYVFSHAPTHTGKFKLFYIIPTEKKYNFQEILNSLYQNIFHSKCNIEMDLHFYVRLHTCKKRILYSHGFTFDL